MGKACVRHKTLADLPIELVGDAIARTPVETFMERYEAVKGQAAIPSGEPPYSGLFVMLNGVKHLSVRSTVVWLTTKILLCLHPPPQPLALCPHEVTETGVWEVAG